MKKRKLPKDMYANNVTCSKCGHTNEHVYQKNVIRNSMSQSEITVLKKAIQDGFASGFWKSPRYAADIPALKMILRRIDGEEPDQATDPFEIELKKKKDKDWNEVWERE